MKRRAKNAVIRTSKAQAMKLWMEEVMTVQRWAEEQMEEPQVKDIYSQQSPLKEEEDDKLQDIILILRRILSKNGIAYAMENLPTVVIPMLRYTQFLSYAGLMQFILPELTDEEAQGLLSLVELAERQLKTMA